MSDSLMIVATGKGHERLEKVLDLCVMPTLPNITFQNGHFIIVKANTAPNSVAYKVPNSVIASKIAERMEKDGIYGPEPDIDGDCEKGWRVEQSSNSDDIVVQPYWMLYHK